MDEDRWWELIGVERVAVLSTIRPDGSPRPVPVVFATTPDRCIVTAVDHKPKTTRALGRLGDIASDPRVSLLCHRYSEEWSELWWVRVDGVAEVVDDPGPVGRGALIARYRQYSDRPPEGPWILITPTSVRGWSYSG